MVVELDEVFAHVVLDNLRAPKVQVKLLRLNVVFDRILIELLFIEFLLQCEHIKHRVLQVIFYFRLGFALQSSICIVVIVQICLIATLEANLQRLHKNT